MRVVLDASVILKWYLLDEEHGEKALEFLNRFVSRQGREKWNGQIGGKEGVQAGQAADGSI